MSGATIGGAIGAVVGFWIGGPQGAYYGWMVGSAVGGYVDPEVITGPRLGDLRGQSSAVGGAIPRVWGTAPVPCNVIWQQPGVTEHKHTDNGKGSGTEQVTFTYTRSYAVMYHLGEIAGVLQLKKNSKIVYDARDDATLTAEYLASGMSSVQAAERLSAQRAENEKWLAKAVFYNGTQDQDPDPTIESYVGVGNAPSYRGRAYMVVTDDDTQAGEIGQFDIVIASCGQINYTSSTTPLDLIDTVPITSTCVEWSPDSQYLAVGGYLDPGTGVCFKMYRNDAGTLVDLGVSTPLTDRPQGMSWSPGGNQLLVVPENGVAPFVLTNSSGVFTVTGSITTPAHLITPQERGGVFAPDGSHIVIPYGDTGTGVLGKYDSETLAYLGSDITLPGEPVAFSAIAFNSSGSKAVVSLRSGDGLAVYDVSGTSYVQDTSYPTPGSAKQARFSSQGEIAYAAPLNVPYYWDVVGASSVEPADVTSAFVSWSPSGTFVVVGRRVFVKAGTGYIFFQELDDAGPSSFSPDGRYLALSTFPLGGDFTGIYLYTGFNDGTGNIPDSPGFFVNADGTITGPASASITPCSDTTIAEIVGDLCQLSGLEPDEYDVSDLDTTLPGFAIARDTDAASAIATLQPVGMFDPAEWDAKFRGVPRGGTAVASINGDDLVERDGDPFEVEKVQEVELLRRVTVGYIDPAANWAPNTQKWERRVGTINARGEATIEVSAVLGADQAATSAKRRGMTAWGEPEKQKFCLPYRLAALTPTDIVPYTDADGVVHYLRFMQIGDEGGVRYIEASDNCAEAYSAVATGTQPLAPTITDESLRGPTQLVVMDLPLWRATDPDDFGLYVAGRGFLGGWTGAQVDVSLNGGTTYSQTEQITQAAVIGYTTTTLDPWLDPETPETQEVTVWLPEAPSSVTYEALLQYSNMAAVQLSSGDWEILQYQTVTPLGNNLYTLSGLVRGRFNTDPGTVSLNADFVLLGIAVIFARSPRDALGQTLTVRATSYGTSQDAAIPFDVDFEDGFSQTEWPVHNVTAERDSAGDIDVSCILRARLGTETSPYHSVHFTGVRFNYSDGVDTFSYDVSSASIGTSQSASHTYTLAQQLSDFGSLPSNGIEVTIAPLNAITGEGPASQGITV